MKAAKFDYARPVDVGAAIKALAGGNGEAKLLAGGQSLGPMLNLRLARPKLLVDVSRIESLRTIDIADILGAAGCGKHQESGCERGLCTRHRDFPSDSV